MTLAKEFEQLLATQTIPVPQVLARLALAARCRQPEDLDAVRELSRMDEMFDEVIAIPALAALPAWGAAGLAELRYALLDGLHSGDAQRLLLTIAAGDFLHELRSMQVPEAWFKKCGIETTDDLASEATATIRALMQAQLTDRGVRNRLIRNVSQEIFFAREEAAEQRTTSDYFFSLFTDTQLQINSDLIREFSELLESKTPREEEVQQFLFGHPIFLDPLAIEIRGKHELGSEFVTDFVLKRINSEDCSKKYAQVAVHVPDGTFEDVRDMRFADMTLRELCRTKFAPRLRAR